MLFPTTIISHSLPRRGETQVANSFCGNWFNKPITCLKRRKLSTREKMARSRKRHPDKEELSKLNKLRKKLEKLQKLETLQEIDFFINQKQLETRKGSKSSQLKVMLPIDDTKRKQKERKIKIKSDEVLRKMKSDNDKLIQRMKAENLRLLRRIKENNRKIEWLEMLEKDVKDLKEGKYSSSKTSDVDPPEERRAGQ